MLADRSGAPYQGTGAADAYSLPVLFAVATRRGQVVHQVSAGQTRSRRPVSETTYFRIASLTKIATTLAVLRLVEEGRLQFDTPVGELMRRFRLLKFDYPALGPGVDEESARTITIHQLLTHTSGIAYDFTCPDQLRRQSLASGKMACRLYRPGQHWHYGPGTEFLGRVLEAVTGEALDLALQRLVFASLADSRTTFRMRDEDLNELVDVYRETSSGYERHPVRSTWVRSHPAGDGGLFSTPADALTLAHALSTQSVPFSGQIHDLVGSNQIGNRMLERPLSSRMDFSADFDFIHPEDRFSYGFVVSGRSEHVVPAGALIWGGAYNCFLWIDRPREICGVFFSQVQPFCAPVPMAALRRFVAETYARC